MAWIAEAPGVWWLICQPGVLYRVAQGPGGALDIRQVPAPAPAVRLLRIHGSVWVQLQTGEARPAGSLLRGGPVAVPSPAPPPPSWQPSAPAVVPPAGTGAAPVVVPPTPTSGVVRRSDVMAGPVYYGSEVRLLLRPFIGDQSIGVTGYLEYAYRGRYFFLRAVAEPLGYIYTSEEGEESTPLFGAYGLVGYRHERFELGVGVGSALVTLPESETTFAQAIGFSVWQYGMLGNRDGLHLSLRLAHVVALKDIWFQAIYLEGLVPLGRRLAVWSEIGGGFRQGVVHLDFGLRVRLGELDDGPGHLFAVPILGGVLGVPPNAPRSGSDSPVRSGGFYIGFGLEWRPGARSGQRDREREGGASSERRQQAAPQRDVPRDEGDDDWE